MGSQCQIVLYQPVIPQNTGSIARLCACTGAALHLVHPLGFSTSAAKVRRAGLDYWEHVSISEYDNWDALVKRLGLGDSHYYFFSTRAQKVFWDAQVNLPCVLVFGSETHGLPPWLWEQYSERFVTLPIRTNLVRSLNLAQAVAAANFEVMRQCTMTTLAP